jgi:thioredoxin-related protein
MKTDIHRKIEFATNIAIVVVAVLLCVVLVKNHLISRSSPPTNGLEENNQNALQTGAKLSISEIDWEHNGQTLLLVLSTTCHFCSESAPFYQRIVKELGDNTRLVAVLPQSVNDSRDYLNSLGVSVDEVKQISFSSINVKGTPTLMLVNSKGIVINEWVGRLPSDQEAEVLSQVQSDRAGS